jgi:NADH-quinone oxidoreductase subunit C
MYSKGVAVVSNRDTLLCVTRSVIVTNRTITATIHRMTTDRYSDFADDEGMETAVLDSEFDPTTLDKLQSLFGAKIVATDTAHGDSSAVVDAKALLEVMTWLKDEAGFALCSSVTSYDDLGKEPRFYVVFHLVNVSNPERIRIKVGLPEKKPVVDSVTPLWPGANFQEREVYDLMGIEFKGHPDLRRIMMPEEWEGHPLRRDYPHVYEPVQFTHNAAEIAKRKPFAKR